MKPKVVGRGQRIFQGNEVDFDITCCMDAKSRIAHWREVYEKSRDFFDAVRPNYSGGFKMVSVIPDRFKLNFCPVCGTEYKE